MSSPFCSGLDPTSACAQALAPIAHYYPHVQARRLIFAFACRNLLLPSTDMQQAAMVCINASGTHGAARIGFAAFPYSVYALGMKDVQVITV